MHMWKIKVKNKIKRMVIKMRINLKTCTKSELSKNLEGILKLSNSRCFIYLEDEHTTFPELVVKANKQDTFAGYLVAEIAYRSNDIKVLLNSFADEGQFETTATDLADAIYSNFLIKNYRYSIKETIDNAIDKESLRTGAMGIEDVTVRLKLNKDEMEEFNQLDLPRNYWWEFENGNELIVTYTEDIE